MNKTVKLLIGAIAVAAWPALAPAQTFPTIAQAGIPGYDTGVWWGVLGPAGLPKPVLAKLHDGFVSAIKSPAVKQRFTELGAVSIASTPEEFEAVIRAENKKWDPIIKAAGIRIE